jgi:hypothetical protein
MCILANAVSEYKTPLRRKILKVATVGMALMIIMAPVSAADIGTNKQTGGDRLTSLSSKGVNSLSVSGGTTLEGGSTFINANISSGANERLAIIIKGVPQSWDTSLNSGKTPAFNAEEDQSNGKKSTQIIYKSTGDDGNLDLGFSVVTSSNSV